MKGKFKETHIRQDGDIVSGRLILDDSKTTRAHKDAFQFIKKDKRHPRFQFMGARLDDVLVCNNIVIAPKAHLQSFFCSDGGFKNIVIKNNYMLTKSDHKITLSGVISGTFKNNVHSASMKPARVLLTPLRIGGKVGNEKEIFIMSFKDKSLNYKPVKCDAGLVDKRFTKKRGAIHIADFDLEGFQQAAIKIKTKDIKAFILELKVSVMQFGRAI